LFFPTPSELFFTKNDVSDIRLGDLFKPLGAQSIKENDFVISGYPDDEGIRLNGGRVGAAQAPKLIRQFLYKMTPIGLKYTTQFYDAGDLIPNFELPFRHEKAQAHAKDLYLSKARLITFGGGHDYGFADAAAFLDASLQLSKKKPLVINFDAHLDVRPIKEQIFHSGTPFSRLIEKYHGQFNLMEIGLQSQCNSPHHRLWAQQHGAELVDLMDIAKKGWDWVWWKPMLATITADTPVFISFDIDALTAAEAGGASQAWATGLKVQDCLLFLEKLYQISNVRGLGIYEVSPPLDRDFQTAKTAALITHSFIFSYAK
jgi:formiminoglutamase